MKKCPSFFAEISNISSMFMSDDFLYTEGVIFHFFSSNKSQILNDVSKTLNRVSVKLTKHSYIESLRVVSRQISDFMKYIF